MLQVVASCINTQLRTSNHVEVYPMWHGDSDGCNCVADVVLQFLYRVQIWFVYRTFQVSSGKISPSTNGGGDEKWGGGKKFSLGTHTIQELKDNISHAVAAIKITMLHRVHLNIVTARLLTNCSNTLRNIHADARVNITKTRAKRKAGYFFVAHSVYLTHSLLCKVLII